MDTTTEVRDQDQTEVRDTVSEVSSEKPSRPELSYDTYKRTVGEAKKYKSQVQEMQERLKMYEEKEMEAQGKHQDLIQALRDENSRLKDGIRERDEVYTWSKRREALMSAAYQQGCSKPEHLLKLMDSEKLNEIEVKEDFTPVMEDITRVVDEYKANPDFGYLFKQPSPKVETVNPMSKIEKEGPVNFKDLPLSEKLKMIKF
jgi:predicted nuclease with TOPRIM domain